VTKSDLSKLRRAYADVPLLESQMASNPFEQFARWFDDVLAVPDAILEPNAMVLGTVSSEGQPSARTVLLKGFDDRGFVLHTNYTSRKGLVWFFHGITLSAKSQSLVPWRKSATTKVWSTSPSGREARK
jgi:pyridoxine/pyridoxamine 5'-phosphate oxidase